MKWFLPEKVSTFFYCFLSSILTAPLVNVLSLRLSPISVTLFNVFAAFFSPIDCCLFPSVKRIQHTTENRFLVATQKEKSKLCFVRWFGWLFRFGMVCIKAIDLSEATKPFKTKETQTGKVVMLLLENFEVKQSTHKQRRRGKRHRNKTQEG